MSVPHPNVYLQKPAIHDPTDTGLTEVQLAVRPKPYLSAIQFNKEQEMEIKIETKEAFTVVGLNYHGKNENNEIAGMWQKFLPRFQEIPNLVEPYQSYGVCGNVEEDGRFRYLAGFGVSEVDDLPEGMEDWTVPEQTYAVFPCELSTIHEAYQYAFDTWLPESEYRHEHKGIDFELYTEEFDPATGEEAMYIYVPVLKK